MTPPHYAFYSSILLTEEEVEEAIIQAKIAKYFRDLNAPYWAELERKKVGQTLDSPYENGKLK